MLDSILIRFNRNIDRVQSLASIYETHLQGEGRGRRNIHTTDVLRAAVVLLHATVEDFLRSVAQWQLPLANAESLSAIPIASATGDRNRSPKMNLGDLVQHRGKPVSTVIQESVQQYLEKSTYNNANDIERLIAAVDCDPEPMRDLISRVHLMMQRRHNIVHRADENPNQGSGHHRATPIRLHNVEEWVALAEDFVASFSGQLRGNDV